jgi:hypothetical protein
MTLVPSFSAGLEAKAPSDIELAVRGGAARALPGIAIQTGEAAVAARLATAFERIADEIEAEVAQ